MIPSLHLYTRENVERARYIHGALLVAVAATSLYLVVTTAMSSGRIWAAERALQNENAQTTDLKRQANHLTQERQRQAAPSECGVASLAAELSRWASTHDIKIDNFGPEGQASASQISVGQTKLGAWNATRIRIQGHGSFLGLMGLLDQFRNST